MARTARSRILTSLVVGSLVAVGCSGGGVRAFRHPPLGQPRRAEDAFEVIDPLRYTVTLTVVRRTTARCSGGWRAPPRSGPTARRRPRATAGCSSKARGDYRRLLAALYAEGYYGPEISIRAAGQEVADLTLGVEFPQNVPIDHQRRRRAAVPLRRTPSIVNRAAAEVDASDDGDGETPASVGFGAGEPARSGVIDQASALSIERWRQLSRAKARETDREVIADHADRPARRAR